MITWFCSSSNWGIAALIFSNIIINIVRVGYIGVVRCCGTNNRYFLFSQWCLLNSLVGLWDANCFVSLLVIFINVLLWASKEVFFYGKGHYETDKLILSSKLLCNFSNAKPYSLEWNASLMSYLIKMAFYNYNWSTDDENS